MPDITKHDAIKMNPALNINCSVLKKDEKDNKWEMNHDVHCHSSIIPMDIQHTEKTNP